MELGQRLGNSKPADLVAADYADQAHMTREFQALTGFTRARYLSLHDYELSRWLEP